MRRRIAIGRLTRLSLEGLEVLADSVVLVLGWPDPLEARRALAWLEVGRTVYVEFDELHRAHGVRTVGPRGAIFEVAA